MATWLPADRFDELVADALDLIPGKLAEAMDNVVVLVEPQSRQSRVVRAL